MRRYVIAKNTDKETCDLCHKEFDNDQLQSVDIYDQHGNSSQYNICEQCVDNKIFLCDDCRQYYLGTVDQIKTSDGDIICENCYKQDYTTCYSCEKVIQQNNSRYLDGYDYCEQCFYQRANYCEGCEQYFSDEDIFQTYNREGSEIWVCKNCLSDYTTPCSYCNVDINVYREDEYYYDHNGEPICDSCYRDYFGCCESCGEIYEISQMANINDSYFCTDCADEEFGIGIVRKDKVDPQEQKNVYKYEYGTKLKVKLKKRFDEQQTKQYIGVELQISNDPHDVDETAQFIKQVSRNKKLICKIDGSLDRIFGVQICTQPCTYNYHLRTFGWQRVFQLMRQYDMTDITNAGLHFHISRNNFEGDQLKALDYFVNNCVTTLGAIGGRDYAHNSYSAAFPNKEYWGANFKDRYQAVNFNNSDTVQLRFAASTASYNQFKKRLKMVHNICKLVKLFSFEDIKILEEKDLDYIFTELIKEM